MSRILVVEDERNLALGLSANLEVEGYDVSVAGTGEAALTEAETHPPDLIILDLTLPGIDGYEVLTTLRARGVETSVLILSARAEEVDKVLGFRAGADDYVTKPFGVMELLMRVQALLRRSSAATVPAAEVWRFGDIRVDAERRLILRDDVEIPLTPRAYELLLALLRHAGKTMSRHELLRVVWGYAASVTTRTVDAHIAELRRKLEANPAQPRYILTVHRIGYRLRR